MDEQQFIETVSAKVMADIGPRVKAALKLCFSALVVLGVSLLGGSDLLAVATAVLFRLLADDILVILE